MHTRSRSFLLTAITLVALTLGAAVYANLSHEVGDPDDFAWFPPFVPGVNANMNDHLGGEYWEITRALLAGRGYADPFKEPTGPTAWMTPLPTLYQAFWAWLYGGDKWAVSNAIVVSSALAMALTAVLILAVARVAAPRVPPPVVGLLTVGALAARFHLAYQFTHDSWMVLLATDAVLCGVVWNRWGEGRGRAARWGVVGGLAALVSPIVGFAWGAWTLADGVRRRAWGRLALALLAACVAVSPWVVRNAVVFGKFIPLKSNLAYELYQSQVYSDEGRLRGRTFGTHPYATDGAERAQYAALGEVAFLDSKREQFIESVALNPGVFIDKAIDRFKAATFDYSPMEDREYDRRWTFWACHVSQPLPAFAALALLLVAPARRLQPACWGVLGLLAAYLLPYVVVSYYDRYEFPLWGLKVLAVAFWLDILLGGGKKSDAAREATGPAATIP